MDNIVSPLKDMPDCWQDEKRMNSLFAPFRKKELNPIDWESKMKFWRGVMHKWCDQNNETSFTVKQIQTEFKRKGKTPLCISTVLEELFRSGELKKKADFMNMVPYQTWTDWAVSSFVKSPVIWSYSKIKDSLIQNEEFEEEYVNMVVLKEKGELLMNITEIKQEDLISSQEAKDFMSEGGTHISEDSLLCILHWLQIEKKARVEIIEGKKLIKFFHLKPKDNNRVVSEADVAIFKIQERRLILLKNLEHLELEKEKTIQEAKSFISKGLRQSAKSCLRKKKELEKCIEKRGLALDNLESLLSQLRNSESDSEVIETYRVGLAALKGTFKSSGLSEDGVFETMSQLQEMNDIQDEIQMAISQPIVSVSEDDLEDELSSILAKEENEILDLPDVPTQDITFNKPTQDKEVRQLVPSS